jgi:hypothetical protein
MAPAGRLTNFGWQQTIYERMENGEKKYSDREVRSILQYAIRIQHEEKHGKDFAEGLSLPEIESVAKDIGVPPELVHRAIREYETQRLPRVSAILLGEPVQLAYEESAGRCLTFAEIEELLTQIRSLQRTMQLDNAIPAVGQGLIVSVTANGSETHLHIVDKLHAQAGGIFGGLLGGMGLGAGLGIGLGVGVGVLGSWIFAAAVPIALAALGYVLARTIYKKVVRSRRQRMARFMEHVRGLMRGKKV